MLIYLAAIDAPEDRDRFVELYETYRGLMYHVAHQILRNEADAEDAVHDAFVVLAENFQKFSLLERHKTRACPACPAGVPISPEKWGERGPGLRPWTPLFIAARCHSLVFGIVISDSFERLFPPVS